jgi:hypothetical protein
MYVDGTKTFTATEALAAHRRVKLTSGSGTHVEYADKANDFVGVTQDHAALGEAVPVKLKRGHAGTVEIEAGIVTTAGATLYGADDGKVSTVSSGADKFGVGLEAASGDGAVIEALMDD